MLVWMDLEMTGLEPARHVIVEIATIVTDDELEVVAEGPDLVVHQPAEALAQMDEVVRNMHTTSGLLPAIEASTTTLADAGAQTLAFIQQHAGIDDREAYGSLNMGAGFALFVAAAQAEEVVRLARAAGVEAWVAGRVEQGAKQVVVEPLNLVYAADDLHLRA